MSDRRTALIAGLLYLLTFAASIPALPLLDPVLHEPNFVTGVGNAALVRLGAVLDLINAAACVGTAVVLYPVLRRTAPAGALGFVASRLIEAAIITSGVIALLAVVGLRPADTSMLPVATALVTLRDWTFLLGPGLMSAINAALFATALWRARLVPQAIPLLGVIGAPLQLISVLATVFGANSQLSPLSAVAVLPIFGWELTIGLWMAIRGFRPAAREAEAA